MDKLKEFAEKLNGRQYLNELTKELETYAKENGIVIVYGQSDDLVEFEGAIYGEYGCYEGETFWVSEFGEVFSRFDLEDLHKIPKGKTDSIEVLWDCDKNFVWTYKTDIPHETFDIMEDDEPYCKGIVFYLKSLKQKRTNFDKIVSSVESLSETLVESIFNDWGTTFYKAGDGKLCRTWKEAVQRTIEWLQKECEDD